MLTENYWNLADLPLAGLGGALRAPVTFSLCCIFGRRNDRREDRLFALALILFVQATPAKGLIIWTAPKLGGNVPVTNALTFSLDFLLSWSDKLSKQWMSLAEASTLLSVVSAREPFYWCHQVVVFLSISLSFLGVLLWSLLQHHLLITFLLMWRFQEH